MSSEALESPKRIAGLPSEGVRSHDAEGFDEGDDFWKGIERTDGVIVGPSQR